MSDLVMQKQHGKSLYALLIVSRDDFGQASYFASHLLKKKWHFDPTDPRIRWTTYMQQSAFVTALVVAYARPFCRGQRSPQFPRKLLRPFNSKQKDLHNRLIELRHKIFAHSDVEEWDVNPIRLLGNPTAIVRMPLMKLKEEETKTILDMIDLLGRAVDSKLAELMESV